MNFNDRKISGSTPLKDFPEKYNELIDKLVYEINMLNNRISSKDAEIRNLRDQLNSLQNNLRAEFSAWFDKKMDEFEKTFEKKTN